MIGVLFDFGGEKIEIRIDGVACLFRTQQFGGAFATIDGLKLDYKGVCREYPDLELAVDWKVQAIKTNENRRRKNRIYKE
jgi:hypothetical protein